MGEAKIEVEMLETNVILTAEWPVWANGSRESSQEAMAETQKKTIEGHGHGHRGEKWELWVRGMKRTTSRELCDQGGANKSYPWSPATWSNYMSFFFFF